MIRELDQNIDYSSTDRLYERVSLVDGVPLLTFGQPNNLKEVKRCLQIVIVIKFDAKLDFFDCIVRLKTLRFSLICVG